MTGYFLAFFGLVLGLSVSSFFGLPWPGTLRIASKSLSVYKASCEKGLRPARSKRFFIVSRGSLSFSAISEIVIPCIAFIIGILCHFLKIVYIKGHLLYNRIVKIREKLKKIEKKGVFTLDILSL